MNSGTISISNREFQRRLLSRRATESWAYDATTGKPATLRDAPGNTTTYSWNVNENLASATESNGAITSYNYDSHGNVLTTALPDPDGTGPQSSAVES